MCVSVFRSTPVSCVLVSRPSESNAALLTCSTLSPSSTVGRGLALEAALAGVRLPGNKLALLEEPAALRLFLAPKLLMPPAVPAEGSGVPPSPKAASPATLLALETDCLALFPRVRLPDCTGVELENILVDC